MGQKRRRQTILANWQRYRWPWGPIWGGEPVQAFSQTSVPTWMLVQLLICAVWCTICVHRLCINPYNSVFVHVWRRIGCVFFFFSFTSMNQNWPPAWVACLREKCQAHTIAHVSRSAAEHSPPTWCSTETRQEPDAVGPLGWIRKDLWHMFWGSHIKSCSLDKFAEGLKIKHKTVCYTYLRNIYHYKIYVRAPLGVTAIYLLPLLAVSNPWISARLFYRKDKCGFYTN